jgi:hypothetical protein
VWHPEGFFKVFYQTPMYVEVLYPDARVFLQVDAHNAASMPLNGFSLNFNAPSTVQNATAALTPGPHTLLYGLADAQGRVIAGTQGSFAFTSGANGLSDIRETLAANCVQSASAPPASPPPAASSSSLSSVPAAPGAGSSSSAGTAQAVSSVPAAMQTASSAAAQASSSAPPVTVVTFAPSSASSSAQPTVTQVRFAASSSAPAPAAPATAPGIATSVTAVSNQAAKLSRVLLSRMGQWIPGYSSSPSAPASGVTSSSSASPQDTGGDAVALHPSPGAHAPQAASGATAPARDVSIGTILRDLWTAILALLLGIWQWLLAQWHSLWALAVRMLHAVGIRV